MNRRLDSTFGILPSDFAPTFGGPLTEEQTRRSLILREIVSFVGEEFSADALLELTRFVETGLRSYDDPPAAPAEPAQGTDPDVVDAEKIRTAVETVLQRHQLDGMGRALADEVVEKVFPGVSS